jgi:hypothetical protein
MTTAETPALTNPELTALRAEIEAVRRAAADLLNNLDNSALNWTPPGKGEWSVGQQIDHLNKVGGMCLPPVRDALAGLRTQGKTAAGPTRYGGMERFFVGMMNPSGLLRLLPVPVPPLYEPTTTPLDRETLAAAFDRLQADLLSSLAEADGLDLLAVKTPSPANAKIRLSVGAWLNALVPHERYHLNKALAVRARPDFPGA